MSDLHSIAAIGCRVVAIFLVLPILSYLPVSLYGIFSQIGHPGAFIYSVSVFLLSNGFNVLLAVVVWISAPRLARSIVPEADRGTPRPSASEETVFAMLIPGIGLFLILTTVPELMSTLVFWFVGSKGVYVAQEFTRLTNPTIWDFAQAVSYPFLSLAFGVYLLAKPGSFLKMVGSIRQWHGKPQEEDENERNFG